ncbi:GtrA family protein [Rarobacter incanus]|uniref:Putative flippase GtrA n=1 Tax=Rarobacter incanus TaxID=153494 RepID=A0A542SNU1_9MICO|nr:GtrA family protein [Rarobacter incanus]TQK76252.1 putative flippase GtrA [Rarobacter incanus]
MPVKVAIRNHRAFAWFLELARFGTVGLLAYVVDVGVFNLLRFGPGDLLEAKPLTAKVISAAIATLVAWTGNRYWTFAGKRTKNSLRELAGFAIVNVGGMAIAVATLWVSHYVFGFTSALADNVAANVVGLVLGTIFRYIAYRTWVFTGSEPIAFAQSDIAVELAEPHAPVAKVAPAARGREA